MTLDKAFKSAISATRLHIAAGMFVAFVLILTAVYWAKQQTEEIYTQQFSKQFSVTVNQAISAQKIQDLSVALVVALVPDLKAILKSHNQKYQGDVPPELALQIKEMLEALHKLSGNNALKLQLIDEKGFSIYRSWTDKKGDNLLEVRRDIAQVFATHQPLADISVGRFNASFKNIVPLFDEDGHFLGVVELIRFLDGLDVKVDKMLGTTSVLLVDKRFMGQLKFADSTRFYTDYLVANHPSPGYLELLRRIDVNALVKEATQHKGGSVTIPKTLPEWVVATYVVRDLSGNPMFYWLSFKPRDALIEQGSVWAVYKWWWVAGLLSVLVLLVGGFIYLRKKEAVERSFFQTVVDNTAELLCVIDGHRLIMANKSFINLFEGCHSVSDFERKYGNLCAVFNSESLPCQHCDLPEKCYTNLIKKVQNENFYLRLSLEKASGQSERSQKIFQVSVTPFKSFNQGTWYVLVMTDVTELEETKRELEQLSIIDTLTQTYNRRYFNQVLESELRRSQRYDLPLSLVMFDIDHFKNINDTYGHDVGDQVLQKIAQTVLKQIRETDVLCRIGGEEFVVILPETELQQAHALAERIRLAVAEMGQTEVPLQITVSLGVLQTYQWDSVHTLYKRLDEALYRAKENGRNRTEVATSQKAFESCQLEAPFSAPMDKPEQEN